MLDAKRRQMNPDQSSLRGCVNSEGGKSEKGEGCVSIKNPKKRIPVFKVFMCKGWVHTLCDDLPRAWKISFSQDL